MYQLCGLRLEEAVEAVRDSLRLLSHGHPQARWWSVMLLVPPAELSHASVPLSVGSHLPGAPSGSPEGESVLARARQLGARVGYMGLEHLAEALQESDSDESLVQAARPGLQLFVERHSVLSGSPGEPRPTPRFLGLLSDLSEGFVWLDFFSIDQLDGALLATAVFCLSTKLRHGDQCEELAAVADYMKAVRVLFYLQHFK